MKNIFALLFSLTIAIFSSGNIIAQEKPVTQLTSVRQNGETISFSLTSSQPFIFANNRYVLYIGQKEFLSLVQSKENGKGYMTFYVPARDFNSLAEGSGMYLSYGKIDSD